MITAPDTTPHAGPAPALADEPAPAAAHRAVSRLQASTEYLIRRAQQLATAAFARACRDLDLTPSQYAAMAALSTHAPIGQNALGRLIALDQSTMSTVVKGLRERGWVESQPTDGRGRRTELALTGAGRATLALAQVGYGAADDALLSVFPPEQADRFVDLLRTFVERHEQGGDGADPSAPPTGSPTALPRS